MRGEVAQFCLIAVLSALVGCEDGTLLGVDVAPTMSAFAASPSLVVSGSPTEVTWTWSYANTPKATTCSIDHGVGTVTPGGKTSVTLTGDTPFTLTCTNGAGAATSQTTIAITSTAIAPTIASFAAEPALAISGHETEVTWTWSYANTPTPAPECSIDQGVSTIDPEGKTSVTLSEDTVFTLTCTNSAGADTAQTTIATTSAAVAPQIAALTATPSAVVSGSATDITWVWSYANTPAPVPACTIDQDVGAITSGKTTSVTLTNDTTFTLSCSNSAGSDEATVKITTTPAPVAPTIQSFSASPKTVTSGKATNVTWSWSYANTPTPAPTCVINKGVGTITSGKTTSVTLTNNTTFTLSCSNSAGSHTAETTVTVVTGALYIGSDGSLNFIQGQAPIHDEDMAELGGFLDEGEAAKLGVSDLDYGTANAMHPQQHKARVVAILFDYQGYRYVFDFDTVNGMVWAWNYTLGWKSLGGNWLFGRYSIGSSFANTTQLLSMLLEHADTP